MLSPRQVFRLARQEEILSGIPGEVADTLDLGIEDGLSGAQLARLFPEALTTGVDIHEETVNNAPACYGSVVLDDAVRYLASTPGVFDVIVCAELIEHYDRAAGLELVRLIEERSRHAILTTPLGFMPQGDLYGNPYQRHLSGWEPRDFEDRGWEIRTASEEHHLIVATWTR